jgi:hypothetical protein
MKPVNGLNTRDNPVRFYGVLVAVVLAVAGFFVQWGQGGDWRIAIGTALGSAAVALGGAEAARGQAWSPASVDEVLGAQALADPAPQE